MSLKGNMLLLGLPLFFYILARMLHPVFYLPMVAMMVICWRWLPRKGYALYLGILIVMMMFFSVPGPVKSEYVKGKIVAQDEDSIVVKDGYHKFKVYGDFSTCQMYDEIELYGQYQSMTTPDNHNAFNYQHYLYSLNIFDSLELKEIVSCQSHQRLYHLLEQRVNQNDELKSLVSLFVLGTKDEQMKDYYEKLTELSLVHLFALSGMHLMILKKWLCQFLQYFCSKKVQEILAVLIIGLYVYTIPYNISFLRAYLMLFLPLLLGRFLNRLDIFVLLTLGMLYYNPYLLYNLSFIFSYLVYFMIILFENNRRMTYLLMLSSVPVLLHVNYKLNIVTMLLSVSVTPLIEIIYQCILYYLIFGQWVAGMLTILFSVFDTIMAFLYDISFYLYFPKPNLLFICLYYFIYFQVILKVNMNRRAGRELSCLLGLMIAFYFYPYYDMQGKVVMISVGQGDCFLIKQPFQQGNILIDTGGLEYRDVATETVIPYLYSEGIRSLDAVFISHDDFDHCGALPSLQEHFSVKEVIYDFQEKTIGQLRFENLAIDKYYSDANDRSTVIYVEINHLHYLFTGDISQTVERELYEKYQHLDVDVLKVAHHGSESSTSRELLKMIRPKVALISVGKDNFYGHPHQQTLQILKDYGVEIYRSDLQGMVTIFYYFDENYIDCYRNGQ